MNRETKLVVSFAALCVAIGAAAMAVGWCASARQEPRAETPVPSAYPPGLTVHPLGAEAPMQPNVVSPPFTVDYGDGRGPQVERGALRFGDAQTSAGVEPK